MDVNHIITTLGGVAVALISLGGILSNNKKDMSSKLIDEYKEMNEDLRDDRAKLRDEIRELEAKIDELEMELEIVKDKLAEAQRTLIVLQEDKNRGKEYEIE